MKKLLYKLFGKCDHNWKRVSTQHNGIGFLEECQKCGKGQGLNWLGNMSETISMSTDQMTQWRKEQGQPPLSNGKV